jgi:Arc/MetJ-type ribon-helix-helix transcriptional regulator
MEVTLSADLRRQVEQELAGGRYRSPDELIEQAVRQFLNDRQRDQRRLGALRRIGQAVDQAGLYERVLIPGRNDGLRAAPTIVPNQDLPPGTSAGNETGTTGRRPLP